MAAERGNTRGADLVHTLDRHHTGLPQHPEVLGNHGLRQVQRVDQAADIPTATRARQLRLAASSRRWSECAGECFGHNAEAVHHL